VDRGLRGTEGITKSFMIFNYLPGVIKVTKSNTMKWRVHVDMMSTIKPYKILLRRREEETLHGGHGLRS
jgi:hypothetical protein